VKIEEPIVLEAAINEVIAEDVIEEVVQSEIVETESPIINENIEVKE
jgi:hypothetical protein